MAGVLIGNIQITALLVVGMQISQVVIHTQRLMCHGTAVLQQANPYLLDFRVQKVVVLRNALKLVALYVVHQLRVLHR